MPFAIEKGLLDAQKNGNFAAPRALGQAAGVLDPRPGSGSPTGAPHSTPRHFREVPSTFTEDPVGIVGGMSSADPGRSAPKHGAQGSSSG